jgi:hypothetical protein
MVGAADASKSLAPDLGAAFRLRAAARERDDVADALVRPFLVEVVDVFAPEGSEMGLSEGEVLQLR